MARQHGLDALHQPDGVPVQQRVSRVPIRFARVDHRLASDGEAQPARRPTALADLDIEGESLAHQDGLAERIAKQRGQRLPEAESEGGNKQTAAQSKAPLPPRDPNAWRRGKSLVQVAIPEDTHVELSIIAKRRRMTLSQVVKSALNDWLSAHGHQLRIPD
jgi:hypothetical protein